MILVKGYVITKLLYEKEDSFFYRAFRESDKARVVIKVHKDELPDIEAIIRYTHEYNLLRKLQGKHSIAVYDLENQENRLAIIYEDFGICSLKELIWQKRIGIEAMLDYAIKILDVLANIHEHNVIHTNLSPENIICDTATRQVRIIDFSRATTLPSFEVPFNYFRKVELKDMYYISPELTGGMNRQVDYRTDYYSLGVIFYEMLTGVLPFQSNDLLKLANSQIAQQPVPPIEVDTSIPLVISNIIMKLLEKYPHDRYQSIQGIRYDLTRCLNEFKQNNKITPFTIALNDTPTHFIISEKVYGNAAPLQTLLSTFDKAISSRSELVLLVETFYGTNISMLVKELSKSLYAKNGYFISGKYQQHNRDVPYSALISAINNLIEQILDEPEAQIKEFRKRVQQAVGINGQIIIEMIPSLYSLIGEQPPSTYLGPTETENRFTLVFENFLCSLAAAEHPLVIFLDNLQWADLPSLHILERYLLKRENKNCLLIGAYNETELADGLSISSTLDNLHKSGFTYNSIKLELLDLNDVVELLADTFYQDKTQVQDLANVTFEKTNGNPYFLREFLKKLYVEKIIFLDHNKWHWRLEAIDKIFVPDNITNMLIEEISQLSKPARETLQLAACLGGEFSLQLLVNISEKPLKNITIEIIEAVNAELIAPTKINDWYDSIQDSKEYNPSFKFLNDQIQTAAYMMIDKGKLAQYHLKIGRYLLNQIKNEISDKSLLEVVYHINFGSDLITAESERIEMASFNLMAGKKAKRSVAYKEAMNYLQYGINYLPKNAWEKQFDLAIELYTEITEASYLSGANEKMVEYSDIVLTHTKDVKQQSKIYEIKILYLTGQSKIDEAVTIGLQFLNQLGVKVKKQPNILNVIIGLLHTKFVLYGKTTDDLYKLPVMRDDNLTTVMRMLTALLAPAYIINPKLYQLIVFALVRLSIKYGNTFESAIGYAAYGTILCILGQVDQGYKYGQLATSILDKFNAIYLKPKLLATLGFFVLPRRQHIDDILSNMLNGIQIGLETGDVEFAGYLMSGYAYTAFYAGKNLNVLKSEITRYAKLLRSLDQTISYQYVCTCLQTVVNLLNPTRRKRNLLPGIWLNEEEIIPQFIKGKNNIGILNFYMTKLIFNYFANNYKEAYNYGKLLQPYVENAMGIFATPYFYFYYPMTCLELAESASKKERNDYIKEIKANQKVLKQWADHAPMNYLHLHYLIKARYAQLINDRKNVTRYFDQAIDLASKNGFVTAEALANELAGKYYLSIGRERIAQIYLNDAYYCYKKWGATVKTVQLEEAYQTLISTKAASSKATSLTPSKTLNLTDIIQSSVAISREIELEGLFKTVMKEVISHSGAQIGYLLLEKDDKWYIEAKYSLNNETFTALQSVPMEDKLPVSIIQSVIKSNHGVILEDAAHDEKFAFDPYIKRKQPKSVLCMPLLNQGVLSGIIYLENYITVGMFTEEKLNVLDLLSAQIVIAINNAILYKQRKELNEACDRFVPHEFLDIMKKGSIIDVKLGDGTQQDMTVMFCSIKDFTSFTKVMTGQETMNFINQYIGHLEPLIVQHHGIIDKYINDTIMSIFSSADDALHCAMVMLHTMAKYNKQRVKANLEPISLNIGINSGLLTLGTLGGKNRIEGTVISDAVNIASRVKGLTNIYNIPLLITEYTYSRLKNNEYNISPVDTLKVKGKTIPMTIYQISEV